MSEEQHETPTIHTHSCESEHQQDGYCGKIKPIKKEKGPGRGPQSKLTKEERTKIQKEKNREAAQRSRDQHKEYVTNLEQEVKTLKQKIELTKKLCFKCQRQLNGQDRFYDSAMDNDLSYDQDNIFHGEAQQMQEQPFKEVIMNAPQEEFFVRTKNEEDDFSYLKMMLFIAMIAIGVFLYYPDNNAQTDSSRHLLELYQAPISKPVLRDDFTVGVNITANAQKHSPEMFMDFNKGLVVRNSVINDQCLDSLFDTRSFSLTNLRTSHPSFSPEMGEGILLCSFEQQRSSAVAHDEEQNTFLKLFLMGAEIKEMVTGNSPIKKFVENNLQLNGIYRVNAEIKQVELISHHNCLL